MSEIPTHLHTCLRSIRLIPLRKSWRWFALAAVVLTASIALLSCENGNNEATADKGLQFEEVRGMVLEVEPESLISLVALEVVDTEGKVWRFEGRGKVVPDFTPSHLNEHKLLGQEVLVIYYRDGEELVIHDITD
ncbi:MAG: hypothetical protein OXD31_02675 [Chloroflexi bacterium]|nr:hypothetical protein [Chloroflexota bacterium]